ncbi:MAG: fibronectin type III domain-containing protein [Acutalibacteraceae bacterium]
MKKIISVLLCALIAVSSVLFSFAAEAETENSTDAAASQSSENTSEIVPQKVSGIKVKTADSSSITLSWDDVSDADGYKIYGKAESEKDYKLLDTVKKASAAVKELKSGTVYSFKIRAYRKDENKKAVYGKYSDEFKAVTSPSKIKKIVTQSISKSSITLSWSSSAGATHYEINYFNTEKNKFVVYGVVEGKQSFEIADLLPGRVYTFTIRPIKVYDSQNAFGAYSDEYSEFTDKTGTPYTKAQVAERYNSAINSLKASKESYSADYKKTVSTLVMDCSYPSLISTCRNIMNMFEGELNEKLTFKNGAADGYTMNSLIEPYSKNASLRGNDILSFSYKKSSENTLYIIKLKSESAEYKNKTTGKPTSNKTVITPTELQTLKITPVKLKTATQVFDGVQLKLKLSNDGTKKNLIITNPVLVKANCKVSTVNFSVNVMYEISESYVFKKT